MHSPEQYRLAAARPRLGFAAATKMPCPCSRREKYATMAQTHPNGGQNDVRTAGPGVL